MPDLDRRPAYRLAQAQAAQLLGVSTARVAELAAEGQLIPVAKWPKPVYSERTWSGGHSSDGTRRPDVAHHDAGRRCLG